MIKDLVDFYSGILQLLILIILALGGFAGYYFIPSEWPYYDKWDNLEFFNLNGFWRSVAGICLSFILQSIFLGPALVLLDTRNAMRSVEDQTKELSRILKSREEK